MTDLSFYLNSQYDETDASNSDSADDDASTLIMPPPERGDALAELAARRRAEAVDDFERLHPGDDD